MAVKQVLLYSLLLSFAPASIAGTSCSSEQIEAVKQVYHHQTTLSPGASGLDLKGQGRGDVIHYFSVAGDEYIKEDSERRIPTGMLESGGFTYRWAPYEKETWKSGKHIYRSSKGSKRDHNKHSQTTEKNHNPDIAIEEISDGMPATKIVAGYRCRVSQQTPAAGTTISACNLKIYGHNTPLDWQANHLNGTTQTKHTHSLTYACVDRSLFEIPERDWN